MSITSFALTSKNSIKVNAVTNMLNSIYGNNYMLNTYSCEDEKRISGIYAIIWIVEI